MLHATGDNSLFFIIPVQAGTYDKHKQSDDVSWVPAFAGMTRGERIFGYHHSRLTTDH